MSDEKETKLSQDELKQVAGGKPAAKELSPEELHKVTGGAYDAFLKIDGIPGESTDDKHKDWIE
jgi:type VI protein secretion system component Hcp